MPVEITLATANPNDATAEVIGWLVPDGQSVAPGDEVVEVESAKAVTVVAAPDGGYLKHVVTVGEVVGTGGTLALVFPTRAELDEHAGGPGRDPEAAGPSAVGARFSEPGLAALREHGLDPELFAGRGLVTAQMVREVAAAREAPDPAAGPATVRRPVGPAKRTEIERLTAGAAALASALTVGLESAPLRAALARRDLVQPSVLAVVVAAVAGALREFPELNARFVGDGIECFQSVNVGVAVDAGHGLRVPVVADADRLDVEDITFALLEVMATYEERRLTADVTTGATVTISDLSADDVLQFQPRINQDQTLAIGVGGDSTLPGHPMTITAVFDHRASTGRVVAAFLGRVKARLLEAAR